MTNTTKYTIYRKCTVIGKWLLFLIVSFAILFPVYWIFISSITPAGELFKKPIDYLPDNPCTFVNDVIPGFTKIISSIIYIKSFEE